MPVQPVAAEAKASAGQAPEVPVQLSATSHWPAESRQTVPEDLKVSTQVLAVPLQWSASSQAPPCEVPVQVVVIEANASAGQAPEVPVQLSATSHWPVEPRQTVVGGLKASTQVSLVPLQWSASSQTPPCEVPVQVVVTNAKASAGQAPESPVQLSATSHWPAEPRQTVLEGLKMSTQIFAVPLQWSASSHVPP